MNNVFKKKNCVEGVNGVFGRGQGLKMLFNNIIKDHQLKLKASNRNKILVITH